MNDSIQAAKLHALFSAQLVEKAALAYSCAVYSGSATEREEAESELRQAALAYFEVVRMYDFARGQAQGVPPEPPPKTGG